MLSPQRTPIRLTGASLPRIRCYGPPQFYSLPPAPAPPHWPTPQAALRFQVYKSAWYSYRDHSKLLISSRYKHLTKLKRTDYKSWAKGLQKAGYATNKNYAKILIQIIEQYNLTKYDK